MFALIFFADSIDSSYDKIKNFLNLFYAYPTQAWIGMMYPEIEFLGYFLDFLRWIWYAYL